MRLIFEKKTEFEKWLREHSKKGKYEILTTEDNEIIARPGLSTKTYDIGYYKGLPEDVEEYKKLAKSLELSNYKLKKIDWDIEKSVGVKILSD